MGPGYLGCEIKLRNFMAKTLLLVVVARRNPVSFLHSRQCIDLFIRKNNVLSPLNINHNPD